MLTIHVATVTEVFSGSQSVQLLSRVQLFVTPWTAACHASMSITNSWSLLKLMYTELVMPSNHLILCHPLLSCLQSFQASRSLQMSQLFTSDGQSIGVSASASVLPMTIQDWSPLGWTDWISLQSKGSQESSAAPQFKSINSLVLSLFHSPTLTSTHDYSKTLTRQTFVLPRLVITFLPRSKCLLISWLQSPSAVILEPPK